MTMNSTLLADCCENSIGSEASSGNRYYCEEFFDMMLTWPKTKAGSLAVLPCPGNQFNATNRCMDDGQWYRNALNVSWVNYTQCFNFYDETSTIKKIQNGTNIEHLELHEKWFPILNVVSQIGYSVSIISLVTSLLIFINLKKLHCSRNILHMHLFISFLFRAVAFFLKEYLMVAGVALSSDVVPINGKLKFIRETYDWRCKTIMIVKNYFFLANYSLLLMEGLYLCNLIFFSLTSTNKHVLIYCLVGWGVPAFLILIWTILKIQISDIMCWTTIDDYCHYVIKIPIAVIVSINFFLYIVIQKVLYGKINSMRIQKRRDKYSRLIRSTLILVLLLGIPYTLSEIVSYVNDSLVQLVWIFCDQTFTAFLGFIVALIYCLMNTEVQTELKQLYKRLQNGTRQRRSRTISNTQQTSVPMLTEEGQQMVKLDVHWYKDRNTFNDRTNGL